MQMQNPRMLSAGFKLETSKGNKQRRSGTMANDAVDRLTIKSSDINSMDSRNNKDKLLDKFSREDSNRTSNNTLNYSEE